MNPLLGLRCRWAAENSEQCPTTSCFGVKVITYTVCAVGMRVCSGVFVMDRDAECIKLIFKLQWVTLTLAGLTSLHRNPNSHVEQLQQHSEALAAGQGPAARCRLRLHPPLLHPACSRQRWRATRCSRCGDCRTAAEGRDPAVAAQVVQQHHLMCPGVSIQLFQVLPRPTQKSASRLRPCLSSGSSAPSDSLVVPKRCR